MSQGESGTVSLGTRALAFEERLFGPAKRFIEDTGGLIELALGALWGAFRPPFRFALLFEQLDFIGVGSISVVGITGLFSGMVFGVETYHAFSLFNAQSMVGSTVALAMARELAPVFAGLMVTARVGSSMATELGAMRVTEQIDALTTLAVDPVQYLVTPRLLAGTIMMPFLTVLFESVGITGAYVVAVVMNNLSPALFLGRIRTWVDPEDIIGGLIKAAVFGFIIALIGCYRGYNATGGSKGVGQATNRAVVAASVAILIIDYFLSILLAPYWSPTP